MKEKISELLKGKKSGKVLFIAGIVGIVLIYISSVFPNEEVKNLPKNEEVSFSTEEYKNTVEEDIRRIVFAVCGDNSSVVTVTLDSGITYEYADEIKQNNAEDQTKTSKESEQTYIIVKDSSGAETPLIITSHMPEIRGVAVICNATEQETEQIKNAVTAAFNINSRKIYIGKGRTTGQ